MRRKRSSDDAPIDFDIFDAMIEDLIEQIEDIGNGIPAMYGFSITKRPGEEPEIFEFGCCPVADTSDYPGQKPLLEVFEMDDCVQVVAELPDVEKENISLDATENTLVIRVHIEDRTYKETIELPARVDPTSATASCRNGILEVTLTRVREIKTPIKIT
ncbi:MAG TPA: Hsp20/alpha crystallin family protein [Methanosarcinales archaeon]|nr:Hsp20/alpha crystallin family protein [Methanosarcinales archaeon]